MKHLNVAITIALLSYTGVLSIARAETDYAAYLETAATSRQQIERAEAELERSLENLFDKLDAAILSIQPEDLVGERLAIAELRELVPKLRAEAESIITAHHAYQQAATDYGQQISEARPIVYEAATAFHEFAADEPYEDLQEQYRLVAESFLAINTKYEHLQSQVAPSLQAVSENLDYTLQTALFLQRLEEFLVVMPKDSPRLEQFLSNLAAYVQHFERLRGQLRSFHRKTIEGLDEVSPPQQQAPQPQVANSRFLTADLDTPARPRQRAAPMAAPLAAKTRRESFALASDDLFGQPEETEKDLFGEPSVALAPWDLSGLWKVDHDGTTLRFDQLGSTISVSLSRSPHFREVVGKIRLQGNDLHVDKITYYLRSGRTLRLSCAVWRVHTANDIAASGPTFTRDLQGNSVATTSVHSFPLRRR